ncbi:MAG: 5-carboxymethyl-2-hydroxymuconate Delta-isomerase [Candidatus Hodarchaeales archaeon]|jgi:5-carboxymethyl-2-hydroxymuconate isomerase
MPQTRIEYTSNIIDNIVMKDLFSAIHDKIHSVCNIRIENCKSGISEITDFFVGEGKKEYGFVHAEIRFLEGRKEVLKQKLGEEVLEILKNSFKKSLKDLNLQITVLIEDLPRNFYFKFPEGTFT